ncbi:hypothetical protein [Vibrio barjaei]|uniref:hypothetical protein n=1 Tax=Vibrio barjaei TaxID=1676683 RepID=UPI00228352A3|nr:hypothetical protein [Vibrio barjaei]MCY9874014.1 hypothetical protein [Vibrio barjaei]
MKKFFNGLFAGYELQRLGYLGRFFVLVVLSVIYQVMCGYGLMVGALWSASMESVPLILTTGLLLTVLAIVPLWYLIKFNFKFTIGRLRNIGVEPIFSLLLLVPIISLAFLVFLLVVPEGTCRAQQESEVV